jgi:hypothetical protein
LNHGETFTAPGFTTLSGFIYPYLSTTPSSRPTPAPSAAPSSFPYSPAGGGLGGNPSLYDIIYTASVTLINTGSVDGKKVVQLYITYPSSVGEPPVQLRGFEKIELEAGETDTVDIHIERKHLSYWDSVSQNWVVAKGIYTIFMGASSRDLRLKATITI